MALLNIKTRQKYLKELGFYKGAVDGIAGPLTNKAYKDLQTRYFTRKKDIDGKYGNNTDILLRSAYNCRDLQYFKLEEFKCQCGGRYCTGYPAELNYNLVHNADALRKHIGRPIKVTSGLRCTKHNSAVGGAILSRHKSGKAFDFESSYNNILDKRKETIDYWIALPNSRYGYCNGYSNNQGKKGTAWSSTMGSAVHVDVK